MVFLLSSSAYDPHTNNNGQDNHNRTFLSSSFDSGLRQARTELLRFIFFAILNLHE